VIVSKSKKPADNVLQELVKPTSDLISQAVDFRDKHRSKKEAFNHLSAISEGVPALGWVVVVRTPFHFYFILSFFKKKNLFLFFSFFLLSHIRLPSPLPMSPR